MHAWFFWKIDVAYIDYPTFVLGVCYIVSSGHRIRFTNRILIIYGLFILATVWNTDLTLHYILWLFHPTFLLLLLMNSIEHRKILRWWSNAYAGILLVSLVVWLLSWTGRIPSYGIIQMDQENTYNYTNYIFCIRGLSYGIRFHSIFLEPGHTAMIGAFTLFANRFNFKKVSTVVILFCSLFTLSLAGYVLIFLGGFLYNVLKYRNYWKNIKLASVTLLSIFVLYLFALSYNNGNNYVNEWIIERLQYDSELGITGNNRTYEDADSYFEKFKESSSFATGISNRDWSRLTKSGSIRGAGYKMYLIRFGVIGTVIMFLCYWFVYRYSIDKRFMFFLLIMHVLAFIQRAYPYWEAWVFLFILPSLQPIEKEYKLSYKIK